MPPFQTRRQFLLLSSTLLLSFKGYGRDLVPGHCRHGSPHHGPHPAPRPGITSARVLRADQLQDHPDAIVAFDQVREIPEIVDGIRCNCGCATREGFYSLLSCYEGEGMARMCEVCQGEGRLAFRLHRAGKTLDQIRAAVDARYG